MLTVQPRAKSWSITNSPRWPLKDEKPKRPYCNDKTAAATLLATAVVHPEEDLWEDRLVKIPSAGRLPPDEGREDHRGDHRAGLQQLQQAWEEGGDLAPYPSNRNRKGDQMNNNKFTMIPSEFGKVWMNSGMNIFALVNGWATRDPRHSQKS